MVQQGQGEGRGALWGWGRCPVPCTDPHRTGKALAAGTTLPSHTKRAASAGVTGWWMLGLPHTAHHLPGAALASFPQVLYLFFLAAASPWDQLLPSDFPGSGGEGARLHRR